VIVSKEHGRFLIGRGIGSEIRKKHFRGKKSSWPSALDFTDVEQATESCLDELFGTLARTHGREAVERLSILGAAPTVQETVTYVFSLIEKPPSPPSAAAIDRFLGAKKGRNGIGLPRKDTRNKKKAKKIAGVSRS
jgi:hypothetical protein